MNLVKLFETQKILRDRIDYNDPDRFDKLVLALLVELGECANEWRGFKFWSKNQEPRKVIHTTEGATEHNAVYFKCMNEDECGEYLYHDDFKNLLEQPNYEDCPKCEKGYVFPFREKNPLLEEYVDGLHFVLELGIELEIPELYGTEIKFVGLKNDATNVTEQFTKLFELSVLERPYTHSGDWLQLFEEYYILGEMLGFSWEQIEVAYMEKNKINHIRQNNGY